MGISLRGHHLAHSSTHNWLFVHGKIFGNRHSIINWLVCINVFLSFICFYLFQKCFKIETYMTIYCLLRELMCILDLYCSCRYILWSLGIARPSQVLPSTRSSHSQKEGEAISAPVLPLFYQGPCQPSFASSPVKLLPQALLKAMILYRLAIVDTH